MNLIDRFKYVMKVYNETPSSFADKIGVQRSSVSHILNGRNKPSLDFIQKILLHFPKIDAQWLINGKQSSEDAIIKAENEEDNKEKMDEQSIVEEIKEQNSKKALESEETQKEIQLEEKSVSTSTENTTSLKQIDKIIVFYTDNTFETFKN